MLLWKLKYTGHLMFDGTSLMGDPLVNLLCSRDSGIFSPFETQTSNVPKGWVAGNLYTTTKRGDRKIWASVLARRGGEWSWTGGSAGTRHFDFKSVLFEIKVEANKSVSESTLGKELLAHGWAEDGGY